MVFLEVLDGFKKGCLDVFDKPLVPPSSVQDVLATCIEDEIGVYQKSEPVVPDGEKSMKCLRVDTCRPAGFVYRKGEDYLAVPKAWAILLIDVGHVADVAVHHESRFPDHFQRT